MEVELVFYMQGLSKGNGANMEHPIRNYDNVEGSGTELVNLVGMVCSLKRLWSTFLLLKSLK